MAKALLGGCRMEKIMTRQNSKEWICILCGDEVFDGVVCYECTRKEQDRQRSEPGSLSRKQLSYIEHLMSKIDSQVTSQILYVAVPDFDGELENLNANQAGALIAKLLVATEDKQESENK